MTVGRAPRIFLTLLLLTACETFTPRTEAPASGPAPSHWGQALFARFGDTPEQVRATIGEPTRRTVEGNREVWVYIHPNLPGHMQNMVGTVTFVDGRVSGSEIGGVVPPP